MVRSKYSQRLMCTEKMRVGEHECFVSYNQSNGFFNCIGYVMEIFSLREKDTIFFSMRDSSIMTARIFQENGMEIDYRKKRERGKEILVGNWFLGVEIDCDSGLLMN